MNNRYDEAYIFRLAKAQDVERIMKFIELEWKSDHILAKDKEFFLWQYGRGEYGDTENINMMLMTDKEDAILGIIGFIAYSNEADHLDISPAMTKVRSYGLLPMTGIEFMKRQMRMVGERHHLSFGTNPDTIKPLYDRVFHFRVGVMQQYYMLNPDVDEFRIAQIEKTIIYPAKQTNYKLEQFESIKQVESVYRFDKEYNGLVYKSKEYIEKRYFEHPIYRYEKWMVKNGDNKVVALLFGREITIDNSVILRIVDFRGDIEHIYSIGLSLKQLMRQKGYEYIDIMTDYLDEAKMNDNGFCLLDYEGENTVPNYFEPFVRENIVIHYENDSDCTIFKADGDQDRPNHR